MRDSQKLIFTAIGIGAIAGLRSMTAPAVVAFAANHNWIELPGSRLDFLRKNAEKKGW